MLDPELKSKKNELLGYLGEQSASPVIRNVLLLCDILIDEVREANDEARGAEFITNQGMIKAYKSLKAVITKKRPEEHKGRMVIDS